MKTQRTTTTSSTTRREFLGTAALGGAALLLVRRPPLRAFGSLAARGRSTSPLDRIQVAQIGCGRMGRNDMKSVIESPLARVVAVCDLDSNRLAAGKALAEELYRKQGESDVAIQTFRDHRELLAQPGIDAVVVSVPDHWHALVAIDAAIAGRHLYVQKPVTYDVAEAIALRKAVHAKKVVLQTGSQQRSEEPWPAFRVASELVRNGRVGRLATIRIGVGVDAPSGKKPVGSTPPATFDYERWLGAAPQQPYMEGRVHPQNSLDGRPGWITTEDFGLGMITNWGAHHLDIAQWAMGQELGGPLAVEGRADFMTDDVWTVHRGYHVEMEYAGGVRVVVDDAAEVGLKFEGDEGSIFCTRGAGKVTASDPNSTSATPDESLRASDPRLLAPLGASATRWPPSRNHYTNWLEAIRDRRDPVAPIDHSARSLTACYLAWLSMRLRRKLRWDPARERFVDDAEADTRLHRPPRRAEFDAVDVARRAGFGE
jgi:predicted dehydrogenase